MHLVFIKRKLGQEAVSYPHPDLKEILEPTYGVITYQEQVMRIANVLAGFSLAEADVLRKAVGKKDAELIRSELDRFVERAVALGHPKRLADELATQIETFGRYAVQQVALGRLFDPELPDRVAQDLLPPPNSWRRCSPPKSAAPTRWSNTSTRPGNWTSRCCRRT